MNSSSTTVMHRYAMSRRRWLATTLAGSVSAFVAPLVVRGAEGRSTRVLLLGDSMIAGALGLYIERALSNVHGHVVERRGKTSTGLARPDFYDWRVEGKREVETFKPDAVVTMFGGNDGQGLHMGKQADPQWIRWNDPGWQPEYSRRVTAFCDAVAPGNRLLFWIGMPVVRPAKMFGRMQVINGIYREALARRGPQTKFLDTWPVLAAPDGGYADRIAIAGKRVLVRAGDGVHLTRRGARHLAEHVTPLIHGTLVS